MLIKYSIASCLVCSMTSDYRIPFFLLYLRLHSMWYVLYLMRILQMIQIHMMPHWSYDKSSFLNTTWPCIHLILPLLLPPLLQIRCSVRTFIVKGKTLRLSPPPKPPGLLIIAWMICCSRNCGVVFTIYPPPLHSLHTDRHIRTFPSPSVSSQHRSTSISLCAPCAGSTLETFPPSLPPSLSSQPLSRILFRLFMPFWDEWVSRCDRRARQRRKRRAERENQERERTGTETDHQHAGSCRRDQEGMLLEQLERPGYWRVYCDLLIYCLCIRCGRGGVTWLFLHVG